MAAEPPAEGETAAYNYEALSPVQRDLGIGTAFRHPSAWASPRRSLPDGLDGAIVRLADLRGKYVVLEFGSIA